MSNISNIKGIDVSVHQGKINWAKVKADGVKFAMIRVGFCGYNGILPLIKGFMRICKVQLQMELILVYLFIHM